VCVFIQPFVQKMSEDVPAFLLNKRDVFNTADRNAVRVMYRAPLDKRMKKCLMIQGILNPCSGLFCMNEKAYNNSFVQIRENGVVVNMPSPFQCCLCLPSCSEVNDYVQVYYFDKRFTRHVDRAKFCSPICCPLGINPFCGGYVPPAVTFPFPCCPTCFDSCGQGVVLHGELPILCCHQFAQIPFLEDADKFLQAYNLVHNAFYAGEVLDLPLNLAPQQETMNDDNASGPSEVHLNGDLVPVKA